MSTPIHHDSLDPNSLLYYAPRKLRDSVNDPPSIQPQPDANSLPVPEANALPVPDAPVEWNPRQGSSLVDALPDAFRRLIEVEYRARTAGFMRKRLLTIVASSVAAAAIAISIVYLDAARLVDWRNWGRSAKDAEISLADRLQAANTALGQVAQKAPAPAAMLPAATLSVEDNVGEMNSPLPLGVKVSNYTSGATIRISGLVAGTVLSSGVAAGQGEWRVAADDLPKTIVIPPRDYVGPMTITAELRNASGQPVVRSHVRYVWGQAAADTARAAPMAAAAPATAAAPAPPPPQPIAIAPAPAPANQRAAEAPRQMDQREAAALLNRAEALIATGDLPAARLLLRRLADTHNARAAYELGATYDPEVIKKLGVISIAPDLEQARAWYQKARDWGSSDASKQLDALARADR